MAQSLVVSSPFLGGLNTELNQLVDSTEFTRDELNFSIRSNNTRARRLGVDYEELYRFNHEYIDTSLPNLAFNCVEWTDSNSSDERSIDTDTPYIVCQIGGTLIFFKNYGSPFSQYQEDYRVNLHDYALDKESNAFQEERVSMTSSYGCLFVSSKAITPFYLRSTQNLTVTGTLSEDMLSINMPVSIPNAPLGRPGQDGYWSLLLNGTEIKRITIRDYYGESYTGSYEDNFIMTSTQIAEAWNSVDAETRKNITATPKYTNAAPIRWGLQHDGIEEIKDVSEAPSDYVVFSSTESLEEESIVLRASCFEACKDNIKIPFVFISKYEKEQEIKNIPQSCTLDVSVVTGKVFGRGSGNSFWKMYINDNYIGEWNWMNPGYSMPPSHINWHGVWIGTSSQIADTWNAIPYETRRGITAVPRREGAYPVSGGIAWPGGSDTGGNKYVPRDWITFYAPEDSGDTLKGVKISLHGQGKWYFYESTEIYNFYPSAKLGGGTSYVNQDGLTLQIRDTIGVDDLLPVDNSPSKLSYAHLYNLLNQGWTPELIAKFYSEGTQLFPANNLAQFYLKDTKTEAFKPKTLINTTFGNTPAPKGHFILDFFNQDRNSTGNLELAMETVASHLSKNVSDIIDMNVPNWDKPAAQVPTVIPRKNYVTDICAYAGRIFYLCGDVLLYSQMIVEDITRAGKCYSDADPTSEELSDVIETDGGMISLPEIGEGIKLAAVGSYLFVFGNRGVFVISGTANNIFTATAYSAGSVSAIPSQAPNSFVSTEFGTFYWGLTGINLLAAGEDGLQVKDISTERILSWYGDLSNTQQKHCKGVYSSSRKRIYWYFPSDEDQPRNLDRCLVYDILRGAFFPFLITSKSKSEDDYNAYPEIVSGLSLKNAFRSEKEFPIYAEINVPDDIIETTAVQYKTTISGEEAYVYSKEPFDFYYEDKECLKELGPFEDLYGNKENSSTDSEPSEPSIGGSETVVFNKINSGFYRGNHLVSNPSESVWVTAVGSYNNNTLTLKYSTDGLKTLNDCTGVVQPAVNLLNSGIIWAGSPYNAFMFFKDGNIYYSTDGIDWQAFATVPELENYAPRIVYFKGLIYLFLGGSNSFVNSVDNPNSFTLISMPSGSGSVPAIDATGVIEHKDSSGESALFFFASSYLYKISEGSTVERKAYTPVSAGYAQYPLYSINGNLFLYTDNGTYKVLNMGDSFESAVINITSPDGTLLSNSDIDELRPAGNTRLKTTVFVKSKMYTIINNRSGGDYYLGISDNGTNFRTQAYPEELKDSYGYPSYLSMSDPTHIYARNGYVLYGAEVYTAPPKPTGKTYITRKYVDWTRQDVGVDNTLISKPFVDSLGITHEAFMDPSVEDTYINGKSVSEDDLALYKDIDRRENFYDYGQISYSYPVLTENNKDAAPVIEYTVDYTDITKGDVEVIDDSGYKVLADTPLDTEEWTYESSLLLCLDTHQQRVTFGDYINNAMTDWPEGDYSGNGYNYDSYLVSHPCNAQDFIRNKTMPYLISYFKRTEVGKDLTNRWIYGSKCKGSVLWDWRTDGTHSKWDSPQELYRPNTRTILSDGYIITKTNIRGIGRAFQIKLESVEDNQLIIESLCYNLQGDSRI